MSEYDARRPGRLLYWLLGFLAVLLVAAAIGVRFYLPQALETFYATEPAATTAPTIATLPPQTTAPVTEPPATEAPQTEPPTLSAAEQQVADLAAQHGLPRHAWPWQLVDLLERNPETEDYVLNYPFRKDTVYDIDLSQYRNSDTVPLLMQWDERWGYTRYGQSLIGLAGCGPTCLSMVSIYLLNDPSLDPRTVAAFSESNGYCVPGQGSSWTLISEGGKQLGLEVTEIPSDTELVMPWLQAGHPIICIMGPGAFTDSGHYIVLTGLQDGLVTVNDPNSAEKSAQLWDYESFRKEILNLWVCTLPEK